MIYDPFPRFEIINPSIFNLENAMPTVTLLTLKSWAIFSCNNFWPFFNFPSYNVDYSCLPHRRIELISESIIHNGHGKFQEEITMTLDNVCIV